MNTFAKTLRMLLSITIFIYLFMVSLEIAVKLIGNISLVQYLFFSVIAMLMMSMLFTMAKEG